MENIQKHPATINLAEEGVSITMPLKGKNIKLDNESSKIQFELLIPVKEYFRLTKIKRLGVGFSFNNEDVVKPIFTRPDGENRFLFDRIYRSDGLKNIEVLKAGSNILFELEQDPDPQRKLTNFLDSDGQTHKNAFTFYYDKDDPYYRVPLLLSLSTDGDENDINNVIELNQIERERYSFNGNILVSVRVTTKKSGHFNYDMPIKLDLLFKKSTPKVEDIEVEFEPNENYELLKEENIACLNAQEAILIGHLKVKNFKHYPFSEKWEGKICIDTVEEGVNSYLSLDNSQIITAQKEMTLGADDEEAIPVYLFPSQIEEGEAIASNVIVRGKNGREDYKLTLFEDFVVKSPKINWLSEDEVELWEVNDKGIVSLEENNGNVLLSDLEHSCISLGNDILVLNIKTLRNLGKEVALRHAQPICLSIVQGQLTFKVPLKTEQVDIDRDITVELALDPFWNEEFALQKACFLRANELIKVGHLYVKNNTPYGFYHPFEAILKGNSEEVVKMSVSSISLRSQEDISIDISIDKYALGSLKNEAELEVYVTEMLQSKEIKISLPQVMAEVGTPAAMANPVEAQSLKTGGYTYLFPLSGGIMPENSYLHAQVSDEIIEQDLEGIWLHKDGWLCLNHSKLPVVLGDQWKHQPVACLSLIFSLDIYEFNIPVNISEGKGNLSLDLISVPEVILTNSDATSELFAKLTLTYHLDHVLSKPVEGRIELESIYGLLSFRPKESQFTQQLAIENGSKHTNRYDLFLMLDKYREANFNKQPELELPVSLIIGTYNGDNEVTIPVKAFEMQDLSNLVLQEESLALGINVHTKATNINLNGVGLSDSVIQKSAKNEACLKPTELPSHLAFFLNEQKSALATELILTFKDSDRLWRYPFSYPDTDDGDIEVEIKIDAVDLKKIGYLDKDKTVYLQVGECIIVNNTPFIAKPWQGAIQVVSDSDILRLGNSNETVLEKKILQGQTIKLPIYIDVRMHRKLQKNKYEFNILINNRKQFDADKPLTQYTGKEVEINPLEVVEIKHPTVYQKSPECLPLFKVLMTDGYAVKNITPTIDLIYDENRLIEIDETGQVTFNYNAIEGLNPSKKMEKLLSQGKGESIGFVVMFELESRNGHKEYYSLDAKIIPFTPNGQLLVTPKMAIDESLTINYKAHQGEKDCKVHASTAWNLAKDDDITTHIIHIKRQIESEKPSVLWVYDEQKIGELKWVEDSNKISDFFRFIPEKVAFKANEMECEIEVLVKKKDLLATYFEKEDSHSKMFFLKNLSVLEAEIEESEDKKHSIRISNDWSSGLPIWQISLREQSLEPIFFVQGNKDLDLGFNIKGNNSNGLSINWDEGVLIKGSAHDKSGNPVNVISLNRSKIEMRYELGREDRDLGYVKCIITIDGKKDYELYLTSDKAPAKPSFGFKEKSLPPDWWRLLQLSHSKKSPYTKMLEIGSLHIKNEADTVYCEELTGFFECHVKKGWSLLSEVLVFDTKQGGKFIEDDSEKIDQGWKATVKNLPKKPESIQIPILINLSKLREYLKENKGQAFDLECEWFFSYHNFQSKQSERCKIDNTWEAKIDSTSLVIDLNKEENLFPLLKINSPWSLSGDPQVALSEQGVFIENSNTEAGWGLTELFPKDGAELIEVVENKKDNSNFWEVIFNSSNIRDISKKVDLTFEISLQKKNVEKVYSYAIPIEWGFPPKELEFDWKPNTSLDSLKWLPPNGKKTLYSLGILQLKNASKYTMGSSVPEQELIIELTSDDDTIASMPSVYFGLPSNNSNASIKRTAIIYGPEEGDSKVIGETAVLKSIPFAKTSEPIELCIDYTSMDEPIRKVYELTLKVISRSIPTQNNQADSTGEWEMPIKIYPQESKTSLGGYWQSGNANEQQEQHLVWKGLNDDMHEESIELPANWHPRKYDKPIKVGALCIKNNGVINPHSTGSLQIKKVSFELFAERGKIFLHPELKATAKHDSSAEETSDGIAGSIFNENITDAFQVLYVSKRKNNANDIELLETPKYYETTHDNQSICVFGLSNEALMELRDSDSSKWLEYELLLPKENIAAIHHFEALIQLRITVDYSINAGGETKECTNSSYLKFKLNKELSDIGDLLVLDPGSSVYSALYKQKMTGLMQSAPLLSNVQAYWKLEKEEGQDDYLLGSDFILQNGQTVNELEKIGDRFIVPNPDVKMLNTSSPYIPVFKYHVGRASLMEVFDLEQITSYKEVVDGAFRTYPVGQLRNPLSNEVLQKDIYQFLLKTAIGEDIYTQQCNGLILTYPNYYSKDQQDTLEKIAKYLLPNNTTVKLIRESDAVLYSYLQQQQKDIRRAGIDDGPHVVMVYDMGASSLDITLAEITIPEDESKNGTINIIGRYASLAAGNYIDFLILEYLSSVDKKIAEVIAKIKGKGDPVGLYRLLRFVKRIKEGAFDEKVILDALEEWTEAETEATLIWEDEDVRKAVITQLPKEIELILEERFWQHVIEQPFLFFGKKLAKLQAIIISGRGAKYKGLIGRVLSRAQGVSPGYTVTVFCPSDIAPSEQTKPWKGFNSKDILTKGAILSFANEQKWGWGGGFQYHYTVNDTNSIPMHFGVFLFDELSVALGGEGLEQEVRASSRYQTVINANATIVDEDEKVLSKVEGSKLLMDISGYTHLRIVAGYTDKDDIVCNGIEVRDGCIGHSQFSPLFKSIKIESLQEFIDKENDSLRIFFSYDIAEKSFQYWFKEENCSSKNNDTNKTHNIQQYSITTNPIVYDVHTQWGLFPIRTNGELFE